MRTCYGRLRSMPNPVTFSSIKSLSKSTMNLRNKHSRTGKKLNRSEWGKIIHFWKGLFGIGLQNGKSS